MFNERLIHLCDYTCLNMLHILNYMLIKHKNIFKYFNCFWKVFLFWKISKIVQLCFGNLASRVKLVASLLNRSWLLSGESMLQSWKRFRKISKIWVFRIFAAQFGDLFVRGSSSHKFYLECLATPVATNSQMDPSICEKYLRQIFQDLSHRFLATCLRLNPITKIACFAQ